MYGCETPYLILKFLIMLVKRSVDIMPAWHYEVAGALKIE